MELNMDELLEEAKRRCPIGTYVKGMLLTLEGNTIELPERYGATDITVKLTGGKSVFVFSNKRWNTSLPKLPSLYKIF